MPVKPPPPLRPALRLAYRVAYRVMRAWWRLRRGEGRGAAVALWGGEGLLVVRTSYRPELDFPGGGRNARESSVACAVRELREEVGIVVDPTALGPAALVRFEHGGRKVELEIHPWRPAGPAPRPEPDGVEIVWAGYLEPGRLLAERLSPGLRLYLEGVRAPGGG